MPDFEPSVGGTTTQVALLGRNLRHRGREVVVVTRRRRPEWPRRERLGGLEIVRLGPTGRSAVGDKAAAVALAGWLATRRPRPGVVQMTMWVDGLAAAGAAGLASRTIHVWGVAGEAQDVLRGWRARARAPVLRRSRHVALSRPLRDELVAAGLQDVAVVPIAVDRARYRPPSEAERAEARQAAGVAEDELAVAYAGHLRSLKRLDLLVDAFARLVGEGTRARLLLAGGDRGAPDDVGDELRAQVERLGVAQQVAFLGVLDDPRPVLWAADAVVLPSSREGMPNVLLEAMACGVACVAPPSAGGEELLGGGAGLVPSSNDPAELLDALRRLAADPGERRALGVRGAEQAAAHDVALVADAYERLYAEVAR